MKIGILQERVRRLLETMPKSRSDDKLLLQLYYGSYEHVVAQFTKMWFSPVSVVRARRLIQRRHPRLQATPDIQALRNSHSRKFRRHYSAEQGGESGR